MKTTTVSKLFTLALCAACAAPGPAAADDLDIFSGTGAGASGNPRVLIVLDNTSNWARQSQQWPGGLQQGQAEAHAIQTVIFGDSTLNADGTRKNPGLNDKINVGLMEFVTNGNANDNGGYVRYAIRPMNDTNKTAFGAKLDTIYAGVTSPNEKRNSRTPYGNLMYDAYNYYAGASVFQPLTAPSKPSPDVDAGGYSTSYSRFASPIAADSVCGSSFLIFIGNPNASGPVGDDATNTAALAALGGNTTQLGFSGVTTSTVVSETSTNTLGNTTACYASLAAAQAAYGYAYNEQDNSCRLYQSNGTADGTATDNASATCAKYTNLTNVQLATATDFKTQCDALTEGCTLGAPIDNPTMTVLATGTTGYLASAPAATAGDAGTKASLVCPAGALSCSYAVAQASTAAALASVTGIVSNGCYWDGTGGTAPAGFPAWTSAAVDTATAAGTCPANYSCSYTTTGTTDPGNVCSTSHTKHAVLTRAMTPMKTYTVTQTATVPGGVCPANTTQYRVVGASLVLTNVISTSTVPDSPARNADEWARFMHDKGIPVPTPTASEPDKLAHPSVITYTIDVYNKQPNATQTSLLMSMAKAGGGKYYVAKSEADIAKALNEIMVEIQAVNTAFASTSLPVNATNRTQSENQVFIGMFRPDPLGRPRWFGNLKRYQLIANGVNIDMGDANGREAINPLTGFFTPCATSFWTTDSGNYWSGMSLNPDPAGACNTSSYDKYSDSPDGPQVEKGATAEMLRKLGRPDTNRTMYTMNTAKDALTSIATNHGSLDATQLQFLYGGDTENEKGLGSQTPRPSIHGDVIHSRPLPINYGTAGGGVTVYYGANDGTFRAVSADTGNERWSFVAPEFFTRLDRLRLNSATISPSAPKDYYFDGSTGIYQSATTPVKVWLYPTMRRGGRMIYALDASSATAPTFLWRVGCEDDTADHCTSADFTKIGQTWSTPKVVFLQGNSPDPRRPVILVGGGYDKCEDTDSMATSCVDNPDGPTATTAAAAKGGIVYVLDGTNGAVLKKFYTERPVAGDIAPIDINGDGYIDYAYAADTGGKIYRLDFVSSPVTRAAKVQADWSMRAIAYTKDAATRRKFLFAPAVISLQNKIYLAIGSGDREHPLLNMYPKNVHYNRLYMYRDDPAVVSVATDLDDITMGMLNKSATQTCESTKVTPAATDKGWFMDLSQGEQTVTSALIAGGMVTFSTNAPIADGASCTNSLGTARGYWVNLFNASGGIGTEETCGGTRSSVFVGGGLPPSPVLATGVPIVYPGKNVGDPNIIKSATVIIGAAQRHSTGSSSAGSGSGQVGSGAQSSQQSQDFDMKVATKRKRAYTYTSGE